MIWRFSDLPGKTIALLTMLAIVTACGTPETYVVRPRPNFVDAAIKPGDTVIVTTRSHETVEFEVTEVTEKALHSANRRFDLYDIAELRKVTSERPPSPCGGGEALGCSIPLLVSLASKEHAHYKEVFYTACETHDYCYRHGVRTYGLDRAYCDEEFLDNMQNTCPRSSQSDIGTVFEIMNDSVDSPATCQMVANDFYLAVRDFGEKNFKDRSSSYCEYYPRR